MSGKQCKILKLKCIEDQRDSLEVMEKNEEQITISAISNHVEEGGGYDEIVCYLDRDGVEQLYRWLREWLGVLGI